MPLRRKHQLTRYFQAVLRLQVDLLLTAPAQWRSLRSLRHPPRDYCRLSLFHLQLNVNLVCQCFGPRLKFVEFIGLLLDPKFHSGRILESSLIELSFQGPV